MIVAGIFLYLICGSALTSGSIYGSESYGGEEWWRSYKFLKFYTPSGKNYFLNSDSGELSVESLDSIAEQESAKDGAVRYISFVSMTYKIYDIFFEYQDHIYIPRIVEKQVQYEDKSDFIRHSLHSFVGPDKHIYTLTYGPANVTIDSGLPAENLDNLWIKTLGPFSKWEHTYIFSENGDTAIDITLAPYKTPTGHAIQLSEMEAGPLTERKLLLAKVKTPSGKGYLITNKLNIAIDQDTVDKTDSPYVTFTEPNGKVYDIYFKPDGSQCAVRMVARENDVNEYISEPTVQLLSFVGPDRKTYQIDRKNENGAETAILDSSLTTSSDLRATFIVTHKYYIKHTHFIFSNEGETLYDRIDEDDSSRLAEQSALSVEEVEVNGELAKSSFLTFYSPSGRIYYITPDELALGYAVAKGTHNNSNSPYITFTLQDGRTSSIYYEFNGTTEMKFSASDRSNSSSILTLQSFVTPDKKLHKVLTTRENKIRIPYIDITSQPKDPFDETPVECLKIVIVSTSREYRYLFTWNGDKLILAKSYPLKRVSAGVLKSLIG